ncbi:hypothetical protein C627_01790 [Corynebacterium glutamicum ZL-6]|nr:hypothetical protein C628_01785 [[Brevibacterium] flavum ZL-1]ANR64350.1 hypothetical protein C627_01790 [Corynebacterium glutamicum ZL-6]PST77009.1 hypothetical protein I919_01815 [Corynebacterium glutamicum ZL-2]BCB34068.1 hypothetical protein KaCgl_20420 [Corynebacterium glutamicum]
MLDKCLFLWGESDYDGKKQGKGLPLCLKSSLKSAPASLVSLNKTAYNSAISTATAYLHLMKIGV